MTVLEALKGINAYPIPQRTIEEVAARRGLSLASEADVYVLTGTQYRLAHADLLMWLSYAPNVSQGGQSYSFSEDQRAQLRRNAEGMIADAGGASGASYGYKGSRL